MSNWKIRGKGDLLDKNEQFLNILIESYDKITTRQGCSSGISEMGKDVGLEWREAIQVTEQP